MRAFSEPVVMAVCSIRESTNCSVFRSLGGMVCCVSVMVEYQIVPVQLEMEKAFPN